MQNRTALMTSAAAVPDPDAAMGEDDSAAFLGVSTRTLQRWRATGDGPRFSRLGGRVVYKRRELVRFLDENSFASTSEATVIGKRQGAARNA